MFLNAKTKRRHKLTSDNNIIKFKKPLHDPFKTAVNQRQSHCLKSLVFDVTNDLVTNQINVWSSASGSLSWVSGGGANLHIHRTVHTKW